MVGQRRWKVKTSPWLRLASGSESPHLSHQVLGLLPEALGRRSGLLDHCGVLLRGQVHLADVSASRLPTSYRNSMSDYSSNNTSTRAGSTDSKCW